MPIPTLLDWTTLNNKVGQYRKAFDCETDSVAFGHVVVEALLGLTSDSIEDGITDDGNDRGIDAIYIDESSDRSFVHLFSFKYTPKFENSTKEFPGNEVDKVLQFLSDLLTKKESLKNECNSLVWEKVLAIWQLLERDVPDIQLHFCSNTQTMIGHEKERLKTSTSVYRTVEANHYGLDDIVRLLVEQKQTAIDREVKLVDTQYFERVDGNIRGLIGTITAETLVEAVRDPNNTNAVYLPIFNDNVRGYLSSKNQINSSIIESALGEDNAYFWYRNNGVTMVCDSFSYQPKSRAPLVKLKNVQIVNGGQTSNALFEAWQQDEEKLVDVLLLVRIYATEQRSLSQRIAESTNSQTPIRSRDLHSNDTAQLKLEIALKALGYMYERKLNQYVEEPESNRVDALDAGQAYLAYFNNMPEVAKKDRGRIFGDLYDIVFGDSTDAARFILPYEVYKLIEVRKKAVRKRLRANPRQPESELFLIDGGFHVLFAVYLLVVARDGGQHSLECGRKRLEEAVEVVRQVVVDVQSLDTNFTFNRFFKDRETKEAIQRKVAEAVVPSV